MKGMLLSWLDPQKMHAAMRGTKTKKRTWIRCEVRGWARVSDEQPYGRSGPSRATVGGDTDVEVELGTDQGCYPVPIAIGWLEKGGYGGLLPYPPSRCQPIGP